MALYFERIKDFTAATIESARLGTVRVTQGYSHGCISQAIVSLIKHSSGSVSSLLQNSLLNTPELKSGIEHALLGKPIYVENVDKIATALGNENFMKYFSRWCVSNPTELGRLKKSPEETSYDKIVADLRGCIVRERGVFAQWLNTLPEKSNKIIPGFKNDGICFTIFGIYLPDGNPIGNPGKPLSAKDISEYSGSTFVLEAITEIEDKTKDTKESKDVTKAKPKAKTQKIYAVKKDHRMGITQQFYTDGGKEFTPYDSSGEVYEVLTIKLVNDKPIITARKKHKSEVHSAREKVAVRRPNTTGYYQIDTNGYLIPLDNTSAAPSGQE